MPCCGLKALLANALLPCFVALCLLPHPTSSARLLSRDGEQSSLTTRGPLHEELGLEVLGLDLRQEMPTKVKRELRRLIDEHSFLLFRGQNLTCHEDAAFMRIFPHNETAYELGEGTGVPQPTGSAPEECGRRCPHIVVKFVFSQKDTPEYRRFFSGHMWHADAVNFVEHPPVYTAMSMKAAPSRGGETLFMDSRKAYERTRPELKRIIDTARLEYYRVDYGLGAEVHDSGTHRTDNMTETRARALQSDSPLADSSVVQPLVTQDPRTGRRSIYLSPGSAYRFIGHTPQETHDILREVLSPAISAENVYVHHWRVGDFLLWHQRQVLHSWTPRHRYESQERRLNTLFLDGHLPVHPAR